MWRRLKAGAKTPLGLFLIVLSLAGTGILIIAQLAGETVAGNYFAGLLKQVWEWSKLPIGLVSLTLLLLLFAWIGLWVAAALYAAYRETRPHHAVAEADRVRLQREVEEIGKDRDNYRAEMAGLRQQLNYGRAFPRFATLGEHDRLVAINLALELAEALGEAVKLAESIWGTTLNAWVVDNTDSPLRWMHLRLQQDELSHLQAAFTGLRQDINANVDPRSLLVVAYVAYHRWRIWVARLDSLRPIRNTPKYREWYAADERFQAHFKKLVKLPQFAAVKAEVTNFHEENGVEMLLPPPLD